MKKVLIVLITVLLFEATYGQDYENKTALIIGNTNYKVGKLKNPVNDARDLSSTLEELGFTVITKYDVGLSEMKDAMREFKREITNKKGIALFYYSGHGVQRNGVNYLIPVDADIQYQYEVEDQSIKGDYVLRMLEFIKNPLNIVILDACRNNPFPGSYRSADRGLAQPLVNPTGSIIAFSTAPGKVASDGIGDHGLYTQELIKAIEMPGLSIEEVFKITRRNVALLSNQQQIPWENSSLLGDFYFIPGERQIVYYQPYTYSTQHNSASVLLRNARDSIFDNTEYAMTVANRVILSDPTNAEAFDIRHWTYKRINDYEGAKRDLDKAFELDPDENYYLAYVYYYIDTRDFQKAILYLNKYFYAFPDRDNDFWNLYTKAEIQYGLGDGRAAMESANKVVELAQNNPDGDFGYIQRAQELIRRIEIRNSF